ncbi:glycine cleavage system H protein [Atopostipes suicloacalis DSM 15692]|uniref:Glycine cleavage system H protein n=1 Tax=Atopostipes suicloacalis DSM 15692 TaxID=1121025 RepID=A0A1M4SF21_9LACT|nr:glycine cleavage system protein H [Atopostipes suicloacalis]SHE30781.1 glycine cleavage system H protein [Atopostipes suicloacalis DSM 15692]
MTIKYTKSGLWVEKLEDSYCLGLSVKGQDDVGDVMYAELPDIERDSHLTKDENLLSVEGAKAVTEIVSPLSGTVKDVHKEVEDDTELLNSTDRAENWIVELTDVAGYDSEDLSDDPWFGEEKL